MNIDTENIVSVSDIRDAGISKFVARAADGQTFAIMKNNRLQAVLAGHGVMEQLQAINEREENLRLWTAALTRYATDDGTRHDLSDVAAEFGIDLAGLED